TTLSEGHLHLIHICCFAQCVPHKGDAEDRAHRPWAWRPSLLPPFPLQTLPASGGTGSINQEREGNAGRILFVSATASARQPSPAHTTPTRPSKHARITHAAMSSSRGSGEITGALDAFDGRRLQQLQQPLHDSGGGGGLKSQPIPIPNVPSITSGGECERGWTCSHEV
ncbi:unnamed protein product, partial [Ectocarpus sp. 13 AM-2016]